MRTTNDITITYHRPQNNLLQQYQLGYSGYDLIQRFLLSRTEICQSKFIFKKAATIYRPSSACQLNAIQMVFRWRADDGPTLNTGLVAWRFFRGSGPVLVSNPIFLWFFRGGGSDSLPPTPPPPLDSPMIEEFAGHTHYFFNVQVLSQLLDCVNECHMSGSWDDVLFAQSVPKTPFFKIITHDP